MSSLPPIVGPTDGPLVYIVYGRGDIPLYVGSTTHPIAKRWRGLVNKYKLRFWKREHDPLYIKSIGGFSSEVELRQHEQQLIWDLKPLYNKLNIVTHLNAAISKQARSPEHL